MPTKVISSKQLAKDLEEMRGQVENLDAQYESDKARLQAKILEAQEQKAEAKKREQREAVEKQATQALKDARAMADDINKASAHLSKLLADFSDLAGKTNSSPDGRGGMKGEITFSGRARARYDLPIAIASEDGSKLYLFKASSAPPATCDRDEFNKAANSVMKP